MTDTVESYARRPALIVLAVTIVLGVVTWVWLGRAATAGIERLERLDRLVALCDSAWDSARTRGDTLRVNAMPLPDTLDARSRSPIMRCGDLRSDEMRRGDLRPPREMSGEPMPRGLR